MKSDVLEFPFEKDFKSVDKDGYFIDLDRGKELKPISQYWFNKNKSIGALIIVCSFILMFILISETDIFNVLWQQFLGAFGFV
jgi:hypothetical protein